MGALELGMRLLGHVRRRRGIHAVELGERGMARQIGLTLRAGIACAVAAALLVPPPVAHAARGAAVVQFDATVTAAQQRAAVRKAGGVVFRDLHIIHALGIRASRAAQEALARAPGVRTVTPDARMRVSAAGDGGRWSAWNPPALATAFVQSTRTDKVWT